MRVAKEFVVVVSTETSSGFRWSVENGHFCSDGHAELPDQTWRLSVNQVTGSAKLSI
jgi:hypothetical protein